MLNTTSKFVIALVLAATPVAAYAGTEAEMKTKTETETSIEAAASDAVKDGKALIDDAGNEIAAAADSVTDMDKAEEGEMTLAEEAPAPAADLQEDTTLAASDTSDPIIATDDSEPVAKVDGQIVKQDEGTVLANTIIGSTVYSPSDENIGDVNDLIITTDGSVDGVVVGVGGFIGIGEKDVAIAMDELEMRQDENGNMKLVLDATVEQLEAAEEFVTASDQRNMMQEQEASNRIETDEASAEEY